MTRLFLWLISIPLWAQEYPLNWPVRSSKELQISSTFGESRFDHFHNGLDIPGENLKVYPVKEGEICWHHTAFTYPNELPFGGGKTVIICHGRYLSGYMHLQSLSISALKKKKLSSEESFALSGNTGHSRSAHLHFFIFDRYESKLINPLLILPPQHYQDTLPPRRGRLAVILDDQAVFVKPDREFRMTKDYPLALEIVDSGKKTEKWGVYQLAVRGPGGELLRKIEFDLLYFRNNRWRTKNNLDFQEVYYENLYILGNRLRHYNGFTVEAQGFKGPKYEEKFTLKILLQ